MLRVFYLLVLLAACSQMGRDGVGAFVQEAELEEAEDAYTDEIMVEEDGEATMETMESAESADAEEADSDNPWVAMFGPTLYKWADGREEIHQMSTVDLLQGTQVVALYYSASWCGPCKQFTPVLAKFYEEMKKKGKKFEVIWVSRDNSQEEFVQYYHQMPWLAVPMEAMQKTLELTAGKCQLKGIPHLVFLDGVDASVYTLDGRTKVGQDKYGLEFPYRPRTLMNMLPRPVKRLIQRKMDEAKFKVMSMLQGVLEGIAPSGLVSKLLNKA